MELKKRIIDGICWNITSSIIIQLVNLITKVIIARVLFPADFGLFAMAIIIINFLSIFTGFGLASAIIYKKENPEKTFHTAMMLSIYIGIVLFLMSFFLSTPIALFFNQPELISMIKILSIVFLFDAISTVLIGALVKELEFKKKASAEIGSVLCYSVVIIVLVLKGFGVWSIVIAYVVQHLILLLCLFFISSRKLRFEMDKTIAWEIMHFGKYSTSAAFLTWAITSIDNIIVGKKLGNESLGNYSLGFNIAALPVLSLTSIFTSVFHSVYAKLQDDKGRLKEAYLKPLEWSLLLMLPISVGMFLLADIIVEVVFGEKWLAMIPLLRIFAGYCIFRTVCTLISQLLVGIGKPKRASILLGIELILAALLIIPGIYFYGLLGVALAVVTARGISMLLHLLQVKKILAITLSDHISFLWKKVFCAALMGLVVFGVRSFLFENTFVNLFVLVSLGIIVYGISLFFLEKQHFMEAKELLGFV